MNTAVSTLRSLLILGRVSNLPTVWSNCMAGWWLSGGGELWSLLLLGAGGTCLYVGGMYLNDAFDAQFDWQHRPERPIPSGAIHASMVWILGFSWLGIGLGCLAVFGKATMICAVLLAVAILIYDAMHKIFEFSPLLMAACRFLLILVASSTAREGITGLSVWTALVMASYIVGLSYIARTESTLVALRYWPCVFLAAPLVLALVINRGEYQLRAVSLSAVITLWSLRSLTFALWSRQRNVGRCVASLLAAIPLLDLLSIWDGSFLLAVIFVGLFVVALLLQRFVPAT
ncbi:MAG TPA: UbiA family prenyltransferase [Verrucomicrobiae bacterium]|nr:UbiA family prenyltransferase [Verrucomicrobiae bacterium]